MTSENKIPSFYECKECGWNIPEELIDFIIKEGSIYCERCGAINTRKDFNLKIETLESDKNLSNNLREMLLAAKNKSVAYTKKKLKERMDKIKEKKKKKKFYF